VELLSKYLIRKSKKVVKQILTKWMGKIDNLFFNLIWKNRNDDMIAWETSNNINTKQKKKVASKRKNRSKSETRDENKTIFSGKRKATVHILDETLCRKIKIVFGLEKTNFHRVLD